MADTEPTNNTVNDVTPSRPIIVNHGPMIEDPTVKPVEEKPPTDEDKPSAETVAAAHKDKVVDAPEGLAKPEAAAPEKATETSETPAKTTDSVPDKPAKAEAPTKEPDAQSLAVNNLVESKKYFLPIREAKRKRRVRAVSLLIAVLIVAATVAYYIMASR